MVRISRELVTYFVPLAVYHARPKPFEHFCITHLLPAGLVFLFLYWHAFNHLQKSNSIFIRTDRYFSRFFIYWIITAITLFTFFYTSAKADFFFFSTSVLNKHYIWWILLVPVAILAFGFKAICENKYVFRFLYIPLIFIISILPIGLTLRPALWPTPEYHLNPVLYPLNAMIQHMPLGVESVFSIYGYYPVYLAPLVSQFKPSLTTVFIIFSCITAINILADIYIAFHCRSKQAIALHRSMRGNLFPLLWRSSFIKQRKPL